MQDLPMLNATRIRRGTDFLPDVDRLIRGIIRINEEQAATREANKAALAALKQSAAEIKSQLSSFEAVMIQEMRTRTRLEDEVRRLEELVVEHLADPAKQLRVDVRQYRQQIDTLRERLLELSLQIEARKQGIPIEEPGPAEAKPQPVVIPEPEKQPTPKEAVKPVPVRQPKPRVRTAEKIGPAQIVRKVPAWAWGGLSVILLAAVFGPMLLKGISAPLSEPTAEPSEPAPQAISPADQAKGAWLNADLGFISWMEALAGTSPDYLEDFSVSQSDWFTLELVPGSVLNDHITDGVLRIVDTPAVKTWYSIWREEGGDFILQFDLMPHEFSSDNKLIIDFRVGGGTGGNYLVEFQPGGRWSFLIGSVTGREELASGQAGPNDPDTAYQFQLYAFGDQMALMLDGGLLAYIEDDFSDSGATSVTITSEDPIDVEIDNIKYWDLSETNYHEGRDEDQAEAFYTPIRKVLAGAPPTFQENFETYQPYWEEMQVNFSDNKSVELSALVQDEGYILLNSAEELEYDLFQLNFPQLSAQAFAVRYDFAFYDAGAMASGLSTSIDAFWGPEDNREWFSTYCDFYQDSRTVFCGLFKLSDAGEWSEIFNRGRPFNKDVSETYTFLAIFYQGQTAIFLDGYFMGYTDGLDLYDRQLSIRFGNNNPDDEFGVRVDNIQFWNLDEVELTP